MAKKSPPKPATDKLAKKRTPVVEAKPDLAQVRQQIDGIDQQIQQLIAERAQWAHQVGKAKGKLAAAVDYYRPEREAQVLRRVVDRNDGPLSDEVLVRLFREVMSACLAQQEPLKIGYLGPRALSPSRRRTSISATPRMACRWAASRKYSRKWPPAMPISAWYRWKTPGRARSR